MRRIYRGLLTIALASVIPIAACGDSPSEVENEPDPEVQMGTVAGVVHDSSAVLPPGETSLPPVDSVNYDGTVTGSAQIEIYSDANGWVSLGDGGDVSFAIFCEEAAVLEAGTSVEATSYTQVRLTLDGFEANVLAGAVIGGVTYDTAMVVAFGGGSPVVVEKTVTPFTVAAGGTTQVIFDLNTELWLDAGVIAADSVAAAEVVAATNVLIR